MRAHLFFSGRHTATRGRVPRLGLPALTLAPILALGLIAAAQPLPATGEPLVFKPGNARARTSLSAIPDLRDLVAAGPFSIALTDLDGDGKPEMIVRSDDPMQCSKDGACATVVVQQRGPQQLVTLLKQQHTLLPLAPTREPIDGWRALAVLDPQGKVAIGERPGSPLHGKPMLYRMQAVAPSVPTTAAAADAPAAAAPPQAAAATQTAPAAGAVDVIGIRPGMPLAEALALAKAHNPKLQWDAVQGSFQVDPKRTFTVAWRGTETALFQGRQRYVREQIVLEAAPAPDSEILTGISRFLSFEGAETLRAKLIESLEAKYGKAFDPRVSHVDQLRFWQFDEQGRPFRAAQQCRTDFNDPASLGGAGTGLGGMVAASAYVQSNLQRLGELLREAPNCRTFVYAGLVNITQNPALVSTMAIYVSDEVLRTARFRATAEHLQRRSDAGRRQEADDAGRRTTPKL